MNYWRILGISGTAFCTSLLAALGTGMPDDLGFRFSLLLASLQGGLALFQEVEKESDAIPPQNATLAGVMLL